MDKKRGSGFRKRSAAARARRKAKRTSHRLDNRFDGAHTVGNFDDYIPGWHKSPHYWRYLHG